MIENSVNLVSDKDSEYVYELVKKICTEIGPGCPCSGQEFKRAMVFKEELEKIADKVDIEKFKCSPRAFLGWYRLGGILAGFATMFFLLSYYGISSLLFSIIGLIISIFIFLMMLFEFLLSKEFIDFLYKKGESENIIGHIYSEDLKQVQNEKERENLIRNIIIFSGHHDSAIQFNWLRYLKYGYYIVVFILIFSVCVLMFALTREFILILIGAFTQQNLKFQYYLVLILFPIGFIFAFFFTGSDKNGGTIPGATDNLTSVAISIAIGRIIRAHRSLIPKKTEIRIISFGSEEAAVRGSTNYVRMHLDELKSKNTMVLNYESICHPNLVVFKSDCNGFLKNSKELVDKVIKSAKMAEVPCKAQNFPIGGGGTDAIPFSRYKIKAVSIYGMKLPQQMVQFYHQPADNYDKLNKDAIKNSIKIGIAFLKLIQSEN